jgi:hypothetical protein
VQPLIPPCVLRGVTVEAVLPAVDFDNEAMPEANEVDDEGVPRRLSPEVIAARSPRAKMHPEFDLLRRHSLPQAARVGVRHGRFVRSPPTMLRMVPPPRSGEGSAPHSAPTYFAGLHAARPGTERLSLPGTARGDRPKAGGWGNAHARREGAPHV